MATQAHIASDTLLQFAEEGLSAKEAARVRGHLEQCATCAEELRGWQRTLAALQERLPAPPEHVLQRAFNLVTAQPASAPLVQRLLATLVSGGGLLPTLSGARDVTPTVGNRLQARFQAEDVEIDLMAEPEGPTSNLRRLLGQVSDAEAASWQVTLTGAAGELGTTADATGQFMLSGIATGEYTLTLASAERTIELPPLAL